VSYDSQVIKFVTKLRRIWETASGSGNLAQTVHLCLFTWIVYQRTTVEVLFNTELLKFQHFFLLFSGIWACVWDGGHK